MATAANGSDTAGAKSPIERFTETVETNPLDFNSWVQLLALVETEPGVPRSKVETTFDKFLAEFPLCFGYWNKYAQYELNLSKPSETAAAEVEPVDPADAMKKAREIYERGVNAARYSVHMWQKYLDFLINTVRPPVDDARAALEGAVAACANDPAAGPIWDMYIQLETFHNDMLRLNQVFKRIMVQPLSNLDEFWEKYNQFVLAQQLHVLATQQELRAMGAEEEMDEGLLRVKIVNHVEAIKNKTLEGIQKRKAFEAGIDRNYFHVTPVTDAALKNWHAYLDYEEITGDNGRCELLYERCLVSCANYEQVWTRYALWKEKTHGFEAANVVFQRAAYGFLKYRASIYLDYAAFLEANRKTDDARNIYTYVLTQVAPALAEAYVRVAHFERRQQQPDTVKAWFERGLSQLTSQPHGYGYVTTSYATYVYRIVGDVELARSIFERATTAVTSSMVLWLQYVQFELSTTSQSKDRVARVSAVFKRALAEITALSNDEKNDLWIQYAEFMETYSSDIGDVRTVHEQEVMWRRKNGMPRERVAKVLVLEAPDSSSASDYDSSGDVGAKRPRYDAAAGVNSLSVSTPAAATTADASAAAAYAQYYQQYQAAYGQAGAAATPATGASADASAAYAQYQQQYAAYYQQQQQQQQAQQ